jgi:hypothetical protein
MENVPDELTVPHSDVSVLIIDAVHYSETSAATSSNKRLTGKKTSYCN